MQPIRPPNQVKHQLSRTLLLVGRLPTSVLTRRRAGISDPTESNTVFNLRFKLVSSQEPWAIMPTYLCNVASTLRLSGFNRLASSSTNQLFSIASTDQLRESSLFGKTRVASTLSPCLLTLMPLNPNGIKLWPLTLESIKKFCHRCVLFSVRKWPIANSIRSLTSSLCCYSSAAYARSELLPAYQLER